MRRERPGSGARFTCGGGFLTYIKKRIPYSEVPATQQGPLERLHVTIPTTRRQHLTIATEVAQPSVPLDSSTRAAFIHREERQSSLTHPRFTALCMTRPREEEEALLQKADRTDLIRFRCGHHPHLRRWQHMTGMSETDSCRFCAEEEESSGHLWLRCPAFIAERQRLGLGRTIDELVRWWWCRPHPVREHAQDLRPPLGARPASPPTRQAAQPPPLGPSTNPRPLV